MSRAERTLLLVGLAVGLVLLALLVDGCAKPPEPAEHTVWIEFESIQAALDAAGKLGGEKRGLTVCVGDARIDDSEKVWMPPNTVLTGQCKPRPRHGVGIVTATKNNTIAHMTFERRSGK